MSDYCGLCGHRYDLHMPADRHETDSATCDDCGWNASGPVSDKAGKFHHEQTGHHWQLHRQNRSEESGNPDD